MRAGLRQLDEHEARLSALHAALVNGENSGASTAFDVDAFLKTKQQKLAGKQTGSNLFAAASILSYLAVDG